MVITNTEDGALDVEAILAGDAEAFEVLVRRETPRLYRLIYRMLRDEDEARSVLQETFLQAFLGLDTFRRDSRLTTWLYGIALNQARGARRKLLRTQTLEESDIDRLQPSFRVGMFRDRVDNWDPHRVTERNERIQMVREAIDELPESYREVVELRDMNELSSAEAAEVLRISEGALRVRLHRGRQALRSILEERFSD